MTIAIAIKTIDRGPKQNYLRTTLENLTRSGIWESQTRWNAIVVDGGSPPGFLPAQVPLRWWKETPRLEALQRLTPNENAAASWRVAADLARAVGADWCLVLEDDIDVCSHFLDETAEWLYTYATRDRYVYPLGCRLEKEMREAIDHGLGAYDYQRAEFWGAQAVALRQADARRLADYLARHPLWNGTTQSHDYLINDWAVERWPDIHHYLTPVPSLVQHIGRESTLAAGRGGEGTQFFEFPLWRGRD